MLTAFSKAFRAAVVAEAGGIVGQRVYADLAPTGAKMPYIILSIASASTPNQMSIREGRVTFNVQVVSDDAALSSQVNDAIFDGLRDQVLTLESPWEFHRLEHLTSYRRIEVKDNQRFAYAGGLYLLEADQM